MNKLIALCCYALSLYGCDLGGSTFVQREQAGGIDRLHSRVVANPGIARFECIDSASGRCHYTLFDTSCQAAPSALPTQRPACGREPLQRFVLDAGDDKRVAALPAFRPCVRGDAKVPGPDCEVPVALAAR
ncbi:hypothetical protein [Lysobacter sp. A3-1-A15]|uniref:hypothetical protein n=1 Tax=Novilysobacter viscosus TaxID=3098602 RepID=UPI002ED87B6D